MEFYEYLNLFELLIVENGVKCKEIGQEELVSVRNGKLATQNFGLRLGSNIASPVPFAIDYYGYMKKTDGFYSLVQALATDHPEGQVKSVVIPVVHFAALKIEHVMKLSADLVADFYIFKQKLLQLRGFKTGE
mgnify:FL=1